jgi:hypothetical protein
MTFTFFHALGCILERMLTTREPMSVCLFLPKQECLRMASAIKEVKHRLPRQSVNLTLLTPDDALGFIECHCCSAVFDIVVARQKKEDLPLPISVASGEAVYSQLSEITEGTLL